MWAVALLACLASLGAKEAGPRRDGNGAGQPIDADGVAMLFASAPGASFRLGAADANATEHFAIEKGTQAAAMSEGPLRFWRVASHDLDYASGGTGKTVRLHIHANGGPQRFTWKTQRGFLAELGDLRNQEVTVYVRVHGVFDPRHTGVTLKLRGGAHSAKDGDLASCIMLDYKLAGGRVVTQFGKELVHPLYDYVKLTPRVAGGGLVEGRWVGLKMVSYTPRGDGTRVVNRLYVDTAPFDAAGRPSNGWRLFSEYTDVAGASTGRYSTLVDWGGWQTTIRADGIESLDFLLLSAREIAPPR
jgi:hypothetical protein